MYTNVMSERFPENGNPDVFLVRDSWTLSSLRGAGNANWTRLSECSFRSSMPFDCYVMCTCGHTALKVGHVYQLIVRCVNVPTDGE